MINLLTLLVGNTVDLLSESYCLIKQSSHKAYNNPDKKMRQATKLNDYNDENIPDSNKVTRLINNYSFLMAFYV